MSDADLRASCVARRVEALRERMREERVELAIAYAWGNHSYLDVNPVWFLCDFKQLGAHAALLIGLEGAPLLAMGPAWDRARAEEQAVGCDVCCVAGDDADAFVRAVARLTSDGGAGAVALVAGSEPPLSAPEAWAGALGREPLAAGAWLERIGRARDELTLARIERAVAIAEAGHRHALEIACVGMPEHVLMAELDARMRELGADDNFLLLSSSQRNHCVHAATERVLDVGDLVLAEITPSVEGEFIQICRTFVLGREPSAAEREAFDLLDGAFAAGLGAARPGATVGSVVAAIDAPLIAAGLERYTRPPYMRTRGHANGLGVPVPQLRPGGDEQLVEGMVFELHPNQLVPPVGYVMCGEPVLVGAHATQLLTSRRGSLDRAA